MKDDVVITPQEWYVAQIPSFTASDVRVVASEMLRVAANHAVKPEAFETVAGIINHATRCVYLANRGRNGTNREVVESLTEADSLIRKLDTICTA